MTRRTVFVALACLLALFAGSARAVEPPQIIGPETYPDGINPLTGLPADPDLLNRRPILIKVSDYPPVVRPQSGLNQADIVWEHLLSGGVTRFSAIYLGQDAPHVGPIRSARLVDFELTRIYRSLFVYSGMAEGTINVLRTDGLVSSRAIGGSGPCPALCRFPKDGLALEHTLYGDTTALYEEAAARSRDLTPEPVYGMAFSEQPPAGGVPLDGLWVQYRETEIEWAYDDESGRWLRSQDGEAHMDVATGTQINAANVLVIEDDHIEQPFVSANYWGPGDFAFSVNFIGSGRIVLLRDGRYYEGQWRRETRDDPLTYYDLEGNILPFKPGNTFVNLVPRWIDGYQLVFLLEDAAKVSVVTGGGILMRNGPGDAYRSPDVAYPGDTFEALGRNRSADWLQLLRPGDGVIWMPARDLELNGLDAIKLPIARPSNER